MSCGHLAAKNFREFPQNSAVFDVKYFRRSLETSYEKGRLSLIRAFLAITNR